MILTVYVSSNKFTYSEAKKAAGAIIRARAIIGTNTVFKMYVPV